MMNFLKNFVIAFDHVFQDLLNMHGVLKLLILMTAIVLPIPFKFILAPDVYSHMKLGAPFFPHSFQLGNNLLLVTHIMAAVPAIFFGPILLYNPFRERWPRAHRILGSFYVFGCMISAILVLPLAMNNIYSHAKQDAAIEGRIGFSIMACLWFTTTYLAYTAAINKNFVVHRRWIIRSYAMTFAFVHVNLTFPLFQVYEHFNPSGVRAIQSMVSWMSNLLIAELYLAATSYQGKFLGWSRWRKALFAPFNKTDRFYWKPIKAASQRPK